MDDLWLSVDEIAEYIGIKRDTAYKRERAVALADYLAGRLEELRPEDASAARVLRELVKNQRLG